MFALGWGLGAGSHRRSLAVHAGLAVGTLARLEAGSTDPSWSSIRGLADALGLSLAELGRRVEDGD